MARHTALPATLITIERWRVGLGRLGIPFSRLDSSTVQIVSHSYTLTISISNLITIQYISRPEKERPDNEQYNYYVSRIRIRSEHCIGWLKGRFASLKGLRFRVDDELHLQYATLWIQSCIILHCFALKAEGGQDMDRDQFYQDGRRYMEES